MEKVYTDELRSTHEIAPVASDAKLINLNHQLDNYSDFKGSIIDVIARVVPTNSAWPSFALSALQLLELNQPDTRDRWALKETFGEVTQMDVVEYDPAGIDGAPCADLMKDAKSHMTPKTIDDLRSYLNETAHELDTTGHFNSRKIVTFTR